jgi:hypothetical protein
MREDLATNEPIDLINRGVVFEERLIAELSRDLAMTDEFTALNNADQNTIVKILELLKHESEAHNVALRKLADKY